MERVLHIPSNHGTSSTLLSGVSILMRVEADKQHELVDAMLCVDGQLAGRLALASAGARTTVMATDELNATFSRVINLQSPNTSSSVV